MAIGAGHLRPQFHAAGAATSAVNPRRGRSYQYGLALLVFIFYYNLVNIGQSWISNGRLGLLPWMLGLHGFASALTLGWLWARHWQWSWRDLIVIRTKASA